MRKCKTVMAVMLALWLAPAWAGAQEPNDSWVTATLLPSVPTGASQAATFELRTTPLKEKTLSFYLASVTRGARLDTAGLRLVASNPAYNPDSDAGGERVVIKGRLEATSAGGPTILALSTLVVPTTEGTGNVVAISPAYSAEEFLGKAVADAMKAEEPLGVTLFTGSHKARAQIYSTGAKLEHASDKPRLTLRYAVPPRTLLDSMSWTQYQHDPEHTGRSAWRPFRDPKGFDLKVVQLKLDAKGTPAIAFHPLVWRGDVVLVAKILDRNYLITLDFSGGERWRQDIGGGTLQIPPAIGPTGILYVVTEDQVKSFDLASPGASLATFALPGKPSVGSQATLGNDGSLFLSVKETGGDQNHYVYGFTSGLVPFLREGPLALGKLGISTVAVRPDGGSLFVQTPKGALEIDIANPSSQTETPLVAGTAKAWDEYWAPVAGQDVTVFADYNDAGDGNLWWYRHEPARPPSVQRFAGADMTTTKATQPVLAADGRFYFIENGILHATDPNQKPVKKSAAQNLAATSNPVLDGAQRYHFWNNGQLNVYGADLGDPLAKVSKPEKATDWPERVAPLNLGPDGTLYTNNANGSKVFIFSPSFGVEDSTNGFCLKQADVATRTAYRTGGVLRAAPACAGAGAEPTLVVKAGQQVLLQGKQGIGLGPGFSVQRGASLLARTGL